MVSRVEEVTLAINSYPDVLIELINDSLAFARVAKKSRVAAKSP
jgi:hypothetical protein